ncbi:Y-family DNA polymerase [Roseateles amylovorans]|uniref:DNA polymerase Y family protein n=1 Tax=Roseateles amylovorans TaxID=2978473 RepID=A0ABY6B2U2_9BURK|nr:DNA polymerase Y family protein [Roseateles amylovorans]UXH79711.1 DNA polymerase Y family protein [Roseateles amylovorans]
MLWVALILSPRAPTPSDDPKAPPGICPEAQSGLAVWCLQFTPRVARMEDAVVMEVAASLRLFRGLGALQQRISDEAPDLGVIGIGWAPTATAALTLARCGVPDLGGRLLQVVLDPLPLRALSAAAAHAEALTRAGINTLGQLRLLPRGGISRRFGAALLTQLDQAYALRPEAHRWQTLPEDFLARVELPSREDHAPALLLSARPLLMRLCGWLAARHAGATGVTLHWVHDSMRAKDAGDGGSLTLRTAEPIRELEHFCRLLAEHLAKTTLLAPVGELRLQALGVQVLTEESASLLPDTVRTGETLYLTLERIAARLGPERVLQPATGDDHRPEWMTRWQPCAQAVSAGTGRGGRSRGTGPARGAVEPPGAPAPVFLLEPPLRLALRDGGPHYQGPLTLLIGPDRIEGGWWDRLPREATTPDAAPDAETSGAAGAAVLPGSAGSPGSPGSWGSRDSKASRASPSTPPFTQLKPGDNATVQAAGHRQVVRDYWIAVNDNAGVLAIFQQPPGKDDDPDSGAWFLHGVYA